MYRREAKWVNFDAESGNVFLLELARQMAFDEGGLSVKPGQLSLSNMHVLIAEAAMHNIEATSPFRYHRHQQERA